MPMRRFGRKPTLFPQFNSLSQGGPYDIIPSNAPKGVRSSVPIRNRLQTKVLLLSVAVVLIPLLVLGIFTTGRTMGSAEESYENYRLYTTKKVGASIDLFLKELERASLFLIGDEDTRAYLDGGGQAQAGGVYNTLIYLKNNSDYIKAIQIKGMNGEMLANGSMPLNITEGDEVRALGLNGRAFWAMDQDLYGEKYIYLCRLLRDTRDPSHHLGIIKVYLDSRALGEYLQSEYEAGTYYVILDQEGQALFSTAGEGALPLGQDYGQLRQQSGTCFRVDGDRYLSPYRIALNDWVLCGVSSTRSVDQQVHATLLLLVALAVCCFVFCAVLAFFLSRRTLRPLMEVIQHMDTLGNQDFSTRIAVRGEDEAALLARQFNRMAEQIQALIDEVYKVTIRRKEAELRALQTQINPHFLYNTLDMVYWTAKMEQAPQTSDMIDSLSRFFRHALVMDGEFSTVANEIEHLRYYIILDPETEGCRVVKLVLQPLVENAILHGIAEAEDGKIEVCIFRAGDKLHYVIQDNGRGVDVEDLKQLLQKPGAHNRGMGIKNVNDRIQLAFGEEYGLTFSNRAEGGAVIVVTQPFTGGDRDDQADDR